MEHLIILVTYTVKSGMREAFLRDVEASGILEKIRHEDGFVRYDYYKPTKEDNQLLLVEEWLSAEQQERHLLKPHMAQLKKIKDLYVTDTRLERVRPE